MIKNILYSLFLHSLLLLAIYVNFRSSITDEKINLKDGVSIGIVSLASLEKNTEISKTKETLPSEKITETKKPALKKISNKSAPVKEKIVSPKSADKKAITKTKPPVILNVEKNPEFKKTEEIKEEEKKIEEEAPKQENETTDENNEEIKKDSSEQEKSQPAIVEDIIDDIENLNLSAREKFNIQSQLKACYSRSLQGKNANKVAVTIKVKILQDGTIDFDPEEIIDAKRYNDPKEIDYKNRMNIVLETLELCSPIRNLPLDKYNIWREFTIEFGDE